MKQIFTHKTILKKIFSILLIFIFLGNLTCQEIDNSENLVTETEITNQENNSEQEVEYIDSEGNVQKAKLSSIQKSDIQEGTTVKVPYLAGEGNPVPKTAKIADMTAIKTGTTGGGVSGGRRGGGGGGGSRRRAIAKKNKNEEIERYHKINNQLEDMEHQLDQVEKAKDRAFGKNKLKLMD